MVVKNIDSITRLLGLKSQIHCVSLSKLFNLNTSIASSVKWAQYKHSEVL